MAVRRASSSSFPLRVALLMVVTTVHLYQQQYHNSNKNYHHFVAHAMRLSEKLPVSFSLPSRARFLSSTAAAFVASATVLVMPGVGANDPAVCEASTLFDNSNTKNTGSRFNDNPRYIDKELQMKYGEGSGMYSSLCRAFYVHSGPVYIRCKISHKLTHILTLTRYS
jgi:hypothetical protein